VSNSEAALLEQPKLKSQESQNLMSYIDKVLIIYLLFMDF
jgi:hypothetical protein